MVLLTSFELESKHSPEKEARKRTDPCSAMQLLISCVPFLLAFSLAKKVTNSDGLFFERRYSRSQFTS